MNSNHTFRTRHDTRNHRAFGTGLQALRAFRPDDSAIMPSPSGIDFLSKYLGTRSFDWPRGNFCLARSPEYGERSGRLELFERQRLCLTSLVSFMIVLSLPEADVL